MGNPSPRYTAEFKQKAVELYGKSGTTYAEVARGLGCDVGSLADWVKKADAAGPAPDANPFQMAEHLRVSVNIVFTIFANVFSPIAPTHMRRFRQRICAAFGA